MLNRILMAVVLTIVIATGGISAARAQQPISLGQPTAPGWNFEIAPYLWIANINSTMNFNLPPALGGGTASTDTSIGFGDLLSHLNFTTMVTADAQYDRFSLVTDFIYLNLSAAPSRFRSVRLPGEPPVPLSTGIQARRGHEPDRLRSGPWPAVILWRRETGATSMRSPGSAFLL